MVNRLTTIYRAKLDLHRSALTYQVIDAHYQEWKWREKARKVRERADAIKTKSEIIAKANMLSKEHYVARKMILSPQARIAHIANAFLKGWEYEDVEAKVYYHTFNVHDDGSIKIKSEVNKKFHLFWVLVAKTVYEYAPHLYNTYEEAESAVIFWRNLNPALCYYLSPYINKAHLYIKNDAKFRVRVFAHYKHKEV
jgi:hypothetical protein